MGYHIDTGPGGGDCSLIGEWDAETRTCGLTRDIDQGLFIGGIYTGGITVDGRGHAIRGSSQGSAVYFGRDSASNTIKNLKIYNFGTGVFMDPADANIITGNTFEGNGTALHFISRTCPSTMCSKSWGNLVYHNNFLQNGINVVDEYYAWPGDRIPRYRNFNEYYAPYPAGGNYWDTWTGPDENNDGFVDYPYVIAGEQMDALPWARQDGWLCEMPQVSLSVDGVYWAGFADYVGRRLSVDFLIENSGTGPVNSEVSGSEASNAVRCVSRFPLPLHLEPGDSVNISIKYEIPQGVSLFRARVFSKSEDSCGEVRTREILPA